MKLLIGALALTTAMQTIGAWEYSSESDAMTDDKVARIILKGEGGTLAVKCDIAGINSLYIHIISNEYLGGTSRSASRNVMFRVDSGEPEAQIFYHDGRSAVQTNNNRSKEFIRKISTGSRLAIRVTDFNYRSYDMIFNLSNVRAAMEKISLECKDPVFS